MLRLLKLVLRHGHEQIRLRRSVRIRVAAPGLNFCEFLNRVGEVTQTVLQQALDQLKVWPTAMAGAGGNRDVGHLAKRFQVGCGGRDKQTILGHPLGNIRFGSISKLPEDTSAVLMITS